VTFFLNSPTNTKHPLHMRYQSSCMVLNKVHIILLLWKIQDAILLWYQQISFGNKSMPIFFSLKNLVWISPYFSIFSNTRQNGEWTETSTRQNEIEFAIFGEWHFF
jgi:hypothetical protein